MNLDVQISTAPDVSLQTSVTQSLQADANLRLRGTATNPALLGRINVTQGEMVFLRQQVFDQYGLDFVCQSREDRSDSEYRSGDESARRGCDSDGLGADHQAEC